MKAIGAWVVILLACCAADTLAQTPSAVGTWQGTLQVGRPLRLVFRIADDGGQLSGVMVSIDQAPQPIALAITVQGTVIKFGVAAIAGGFEGRLSADGNTLTGSFSQGGMSIPLSLVRATPETAWAIPAPPAALAPMAATATPVFEVASIRPSNPSAQGKLFTFRGRQVLTINTTLNDLIAFAYGLHPGQIAGAPDWAGSAKYDITGQPDLPGQPNIAQMRGMVEKLLATRFGLVFHRDKRELPVYALVVGARGPMLTRSAGDPNGLPSLLFPRLGVLPVQNASMADFAGTMQSAVLDRPVVERTGLAGRYDFTLTWTPDESQFTSMGIRVPAPTGDPAAPPGLFTAIQEQLGLRFESTRAPVEVIVIDSVAPPSEN